ncbi:MAG: prolyl oligopeptidase family serine peptidase [Gammaproteobacteria bacterium]|nr:prolyl oligopeptidase family serine peptidase [Gammaproteobacteria bacterium]
MSRKHTVPYGGWKSPLTAQWVASGTVGLAEVRLDGSDIYWVEQRTVEGGRSVVVRYRQGVVSDITPDSVSVRTKVHEYGGGAYTVEDGNVYFCNDRDQGVYCQNEQGEMALLLQQSSKRYADFLVDTHHHRLIAICEDHSGGSEPINTVISIDLHQKNACTTLVSGDDFYASACLSPDGSKLAWLSWNHPNMPWDGCQLWMAEVGESGAVTSRKIIAGGADESIFQPQFSPDGTLYFVSDRSGWWNLYRWGGEVVTPVWLAAVECGLPQWQFSMSTYAFLSQQLVVITFCDQGSWKLGKVDLTTGAMEQIESAYSEFTSIRGSGNGRCLFLAASPFEGKAVVMLGGNGDELKKVHFAGDSFSHSGYFSQPQAISFPVNDNQLAYGFYYAPANKDYMGASGSLPPLIVRTHGGPTAAAISTFNPKIQYWTSRGYAVLDVNYAGSTGYGRRYRDRLNGGWGVADVRDCICGANYLANQGKVDKQRLIITGSSAGGYTVLSALTFADTFKAGASYYGISELESLVIHTHKFEAHYLDRLIGPYPEQKHLYRNRSPINHVNRFSCPIIFFQGLEDKVVPPSQAQNMVDALDHKGLAVAYVTFANEQHGFRRSENIAKALESELYFYSSVFGIELPDKIESIPIRNFPNE